MRLLLVIILLLISGSVFPEVQGWFISKSNNKLIVNQGDIFDATIMIWPFDSFEIENLRGMEGKSFLSNFQLLKIKKISFSANNQEILEIRGQFICISPFYVDVINASYDGKKIDFRIKNIEFGRKIKTPIKMIFVDQETVISTTQNIYAAWILLILFLLILFRYLKARKSAKPIFNIEARDGSNWINRIKKASSREDFEYLYISRKKWKKNYPSGDREVQEFFKELNLYQYKREWSQEELLIVKNKHSKLIEKLESNNDGV